MNWMNLPPKYSKGKFVIFPIEYEKDLTYGKGAVNGSKEIIKASQHLEYYDLELDKEAYLEGIELLEPLKLEDVLPENMVEVVSNKIKEIKKDNEKNKFIITLGGDHAVALGITKGLEQLDEDFSVIILDAHADFFHSWNGSQYNHRCVAQRLSADHEVALVGVRAMDKDEKEIIRSKENVHLVTANAYNLNKIKELLPKLKKKVYLSIDVDVFDPAFIRNTGTPEPGGFDWNQVNEILKLIFQEKEVIGADLVEFAPQENYRAEAYSLAKLIYRIVGMEGHY